MEHISHTDDSEFIKIAESNLNKVNSSISKLSYADGITDGRQSKFQREFDFGYKNGFQRAFQLAKYHYFSTTFLKSEGSIHQELINEAKNFISMKTQYNQENSRSNENLSFNKISSKTEEETKQYLEEIKNKFPNLSNLLK